MHCVKSVRIWSYSGTYFPAFGLNNETYSASLRIQCECGKIQTRITPNMDTFYAVIVFKIWLKNSVPFSISKQNADWISLKWNAQGTIFIPIYHFHTLIETLICIWDYYHVFLIAGHVITRLLLEETKPGRGSILLAVFTW